MKNIIINLPIHHFVDEIPKYLAKIPFDNLNIGYIGHSILHESLFSNVLTI